MDETYRMLGAERQADLEREAARRRLAAQLPPRQRRHWRSARMTPAAVLHRLMLALRRSPATPALRVRR
jgi:hypothetical protein